MRLLFLSDFHGRMPELDDWSFDLVVAGGDYCEVDEIRSLKFKALERGIHPSKWTTLIGSDRADALVERALAEGSAVVSALAECGAPVLAIPGNSDRVAYFGPHLADRHVPRPDQPHVEGRVTNIETQVVVHGALAFAGLGGWSGPHTEERMNSEIPKLERMMRDIGRPLVLVSHNVPFESELDGVNNPDLPAFAQGKMVGSRRCVAAIESLKPVLCLCGHLHENYGRRQTIGETLCICGAGAYRGEGVLVDVDDAGNVEDVQFVRSTSGATRLVV